MYNIDVYMNALMNREAEAWNLESLLLKRQHLAGSSSIAASVTKGSNVLSYLSSAHHGIKAIGQRIKRLSLYYLTETTNSFLSKLLGAKIGVYTRNSYVYYIINIYVKALRGKA